MKAVSFWGKILNISGTFLNRVNRVVEAFSTAILFFAVFVVLLQIILRSIGYGRTVQWVWESIILVNVWLTYLGASVLAKEEKNITLRAYEILPPAIQKFLRFFVRVIIVTTSVVVAAQSYKLVLRQMQNPFVTLPYLTRGHGTLVIVIGFSLIALYSLYHILTAGKEKE